MLAYARAMLDAASQAQAHFAGQMLSGVVRFGLVEDFALIGLAALLAALRQHHPQLRLSTEVGMCDDLFAAFDAGRLDVVLAKRPQGSARGVPLWQEDLAWVGLPGVLHAAQDGPVPLALYPPRTALRGAVERALRNAGRAWTVMFESASIASLRAAVRAGVGLSAFGRNLLPALGMIEYVLDRPRPHGVQRIKGGIPDGVGQSGARRAADRRLRDDGVNRSEPRQAVLHPKPGDVAGQRLFGERGRSEAGLHGGVQARGAGALERHRPAPAGGGNRDSVSPPCNAGAGVGFRRRLQRLIKLHGLSEAERRQA